MLTSAPMLPEEDVPEVLLDDVRAIVESSGLVPAFAADRRFEVFAANASARQLFRPFAATKRALPRTVRGECFASRITVFSHGNTWEVQARRMVDNVRAAYARYYGDVYLEGLIAEL